jgi:hypothetical protein
MALSANMVEIILNMAGISNIIKIVGVTAKTICRCVLVPISMAGDTLQGNMRPC